MKRLLLIFVALFVCSAPALAQDFNTTFTLNSANQTGPGAGPLRDVRSQGFISYALSWSTNGTVSAGACALLGSADNVTFGTTIIAAQAVTSSGATVLTAANTNFIEVSCTTPITGTGNVQMRIMAWRPTNASVSVGNISGNDAASATGAAVPAKGSYTAVNVGGTLTGVTGTGTSMNVNVTGGTSTGVAQGSTSSGQTVTPGGCATTTSAPTNTTAQTNMLSCDTSGALRITGATNGTVAQGSTTSGQSGQLIQGAVTTGAPSYTNGQTSPLNMDVAGNLRVSAGGVAQGSTTSGQSVLPAGCSTTTSAPTTTTAQTNMLNCDTTGALRIAQPTAALLNATVQPGNTANTTPWLVSTPYQFPCVDRSGSIATGGTAVTAAAQNSSRQNITLLNYPDATTQGVSVAENLFFSFSGTATESAGVPASGVGVLLPGQSITFGPVVTIQALSVNAATTGHKWYSCEQ